MVMVYVDIGLIPSLLPTIIQVVLLYCWVFIVVSMKEVDICIRSENFLNIIMVEYTLPTQGSFKKLFQGGFEENFFKTVTKAVSYIHIKTILIIIIQAWHHTLI